MIIYLKKVTVKVMRKNDKISTHEKRLSNVRKLTKCPYCGDRGGMVNKFTITGEDYYDFQGNFLGEEFDGFYKNNKRLVCKKCRKQIMKFDELIKINEQNFDK